MIIIKRWTIIYGLLITCVHISIAQNELSIFSDSLSIENTQFGIPSVGLGLSGLNIGSGFSESLLTPFELRIIQTPLLPFFGSSRLSYNSLVLEYSDIGFYDLDWDLTTSHDAQKFSIGYEYTKLPGGTSFHHMPFLIQTDTATLSNYFLLSDQVGINVDTVQENRLAIFTDNDIYTNDTKGAIQVYKNTGSVGAAISGIGNSTGDNNGAQMTTGTLAGFGPTGNVGVYGHAIDTMMVGVVGGNGGDHYGPDRWAALGTSQYAVYANGAQFSTSSALWSTSDIRLKNQVKSSSDMLTKVLQLSPKNYKYSSSDKFKNLSFPTEVQHGFSAQEVEKIFPELVREVTLLGLSKDVIQKKYKAINYHGFFSILTQAIQESHQQKVEQGQSIERLEQANKRLKERIIYQEKLLQEVLERVGETKIKE